MNAGSGIKSGSALFENPGSHFRFPGGEERHLPGLVQHEPNQLVFVRRLKPHLLDERLAFFRLHRVQFQLKGNGRGENLDAFDAVVKPVKIGLVVAAVDDDHSRLFAEQTEGASAFLLVFGHVVQRHRLFVFQAGENLL